MYDKTRLIRVIRLHNNGKNIDYNNDNDYKDNSNNCKVKGNIHVSIKVSDINFLLLLKFLEDRRHHRFPLLV